ncbi:uncharacterized protein LOC112170758 [Rosa chinensis]|uniref:uncharacterized protein LOC112170758 n=1 Tax=Rosa chinensis TaxID=74649 RepID=UPI000D08BC51|nr:uncharacterized protein LOC112170758 [Rosa chinensis]
MEATGFSGGIWLLWDKSKLSVDVIDAHSQAITAKINLPRASSWILSIIYASPTYSMRASLWGYLENVFAAAGLPYALIGDFNELLDSSDKNMGSLVGLFGGLRDWVNRNGIIDIGFQGSAYTWTNGRIKERLERRLHSNNLSNCDAMPFKFQAMWLTHSNFTPFIAQTWNAAPGDFQGIQKSRDKSNNPFLIQLEDDLLKEYEVIRDQESLLWRQKSRDKWLQDGDRNTRFFHLTTVIRRRKNKIEGLFDDNEEWHCDMAHMKGIAVQFFTSLFSDNNGDELRFFIPYLFPIIETQLLSSTTAEITMNEVKKAMFSIGGLKAPGYLIVKLTYIDAKVCDFWDNNVWNMKLLSSCLPSDIIHKIISVPPGFDGCGEHVQIWGKTSNGVL